MLRPAMSKADAIGFIVLCSACEDSAGAVSVFPQAVRSARTAFRRIAFSCFANQAAGDFCACVSGRLRPEIIGIAVDHHGSPDDFLHTKTICPDSQICTAAALHQGREISRMIWMSGSRRIIVAACIRKSLAGAASSFMDVKGKETGLAVPRKS